MRREADTDATGPLRDDRDAGGAHADHDRSGNGGDSRHAGDRGAVLGVPRDVVVLGVARMADAFGNAFLIVVLPLYIASGDVGGSLLGLSESAISGLVLGLFGLIASLAQPWTGRLTDRLGRRQAVILVGLLLFAVANASFAFVSTYPWMLVVRAAQGLGAALTITASVTLVNEVSSSADRGGNMGVYNSFRLVGFGGGPLVAGVAVENGPYDLGVLTLSGFDAAFAIAAGAAVLSAGAVAVFVSDPDIVRPSDRRIALRIRGEHGGLDAIFTLGIATFVMAGAFALLATIEPEVNERLGQGPVLFAVEFAALIAALAVLQPFTGRASDRLGRLPFIFWGLVALVPTTLIQGFVVAPWQLIAARAAQGASAAMVFAPALALAGELAREGESASKLAVLTMSFGLGIAAGQFSSGFLVGIDFAAPFVFGASLAAVGAVLVRTQVGPSLERG